jgi:hypothetical protein
MWRYDVNSGTTPHNALPNAKIGPGIINGTEDLERGPDGKFYVTQNRFAGTDVASVFVTDPNGTVLWNSLQASRDLLLNPTAPDILNNTFAGVAVSPDGLWMATLQNFSNIMIVPLVNGIPDLAGRMVVATGQHINSGRGIAFDAAGNLHYVSSGQARYRQLSPGGETITTLSWDGTQYDFDVLNIVPPDELLGDFNNDGEVDSADYVMWVKAGSAELPNDGDAADQAARYALWVAHFGEPAAGSGSGNGSVPEPATAVLTLIALVAAGCGCRRRG